MLLLAGEQGVHWAVAHEHLALSAQQLLWLYPVRAIVVAGLLWHLRPLWPELKWRDLSVWRHTLLALVVGVAVWGLWLTLDMGAQASGGYDPTLLAPPGSYILVIMRLAGAVLVVPLMEELFWRSFLLRYLINPDFQQVPVGAFSWMSCLWVTVLFGLEHHQIIAGMVAGLAYNLLIYRTQSVAQCVLSHAVTNLLLGLYVLQSGAWYFW